MASRLGVAPINLGKSAWSEYEKVVKSLRTTESLGIVEYLLMSMCSFNHRICSVEIWNTLVRIYFRGADYRMKARCIEKPIVMAYRKDAPDTHTFDGEAETCRKEDERDVN